jgi:hypothetical protein
MEQNADSRFKNRIEMLKMLEWLEWLRIETSIRGKQTELSQVFSRRVSVPMNLAPPVEKRA